MAVHLGQVLRELYLETGLKMERFRDGIPYASKTIYYHFQQTHLNTEILENYEQGLKKLGFPVDIWDLIARKRHGETLERPMHSSTVSEPAAPYGKPDTAADLLRRAAELLDKERSAPAPNRDKEQP